ncbi:MAG: hypothetical protein WCJ30_04635 [Deltaproteobacteria bacterium]
MVDAIYISVRAALDLAIAEKATIRLVLRGDLERGRPIRMIDGEPYEVGVGPDGRERVFMRIAESTEQIVLVDRIARVLSEA